MSRELIGERKFAGMALGSQWYSNDHSRPIEVRRASPGEEMGIEFIEIKFRRGSQSADDFITCVLAGRYEPQNDEARIAKAFAEELKE